MAAYHRVYDSRHLQADCQEPGLAPEPYIRQSSMGYLFTCIKGQMFALVISGRVSKGANVQEVSVP